MKLVSRKDFLALPSGTLFCQCEEEWAFDDLHVKFDSLMHTEEDGDFVSMPFTSFEASSSDQWCSRLDQMDKTGSSFPLDLDSSGRDGLFVRQSKFLVYEHADLVKLRDFLSSLIEQSAG